ncbi:MAG: 4-alpha-glucanotransferase [Nitrospinae bacterium]|nr:4-alpha-glucanotransferase [Nitrospinota bacterium]
MKGRLCMESQRASGILLHPTSLPGPFGIGDLGAEAHRFVDFLGKSGQQLWQVLPLGPIGVGNSPYQGFSAFAGNPLLISLETLIQEGLLSPHAVGEVPPFPKGRVDYKAVRQFKMPLLWKSFEQFQAGAPGQQQAMREAFGHHHATWLDDYALFMALKEEHRGAVWSQWEHEIAFRAPEAMAGWRRKLASSVQFHTYLQCQFFRQWHGLRTHCKAQGLRIIGDLPIFVAHDSADVWAHPELWHLDEAGNPMVVAGVPPDYFSTTGQLWGNPLYRWDVMAASGYAWWVQRFQFLQEMVDIVRLDHFRGFEAYWEVPAGETTAINGRWVKGPGGCLFEALHTALGALPIIAEDLGVITPQVVALRECFGFPGMRVLQFAFGKRARAQEDHPHNYPRHSVVYTGTHDNNTTVGWFTEVGTGDSTRSLADIEAGRALALKYLGTDGSQIHWDMIRLALASPADTAIIPLQDVLGLGSEARMNRPGTARGNWEWRVAAEMLTSELAGRLRELTELYGR